MVFFFFRRRRRKKGYRPLLVLLLSFLFGDEGKGSGVAGAGSAVHVLVKPVSVPITARARVQIWGSRVTRSRSVVCCRTKVCIVDTVHVCRAFLFCVLGPLAAIAARAAPIFKFLPTDSSTGGPRLCRYAAGCEIECGAILPDVRKSVRCLILHLPWKFEFCVEEPRSFVLAGRT